MDEGGITFAVEKCGDKWRVRLHEKGDFGVVVYACSDEDEARLHARMMRLVSNYFDAKP